MIAAGERWVSLEVVRGSFGPEDSVNDLAQIKFEKPVPVKVSGNKNDSFNWATGAVGYHFKQRVLNGTGHGHGKPIGSRTSGLSFSQRQYRN